MALEFTVSALIPADPDAVYTAWLDADLHSEMTGGAATVDPTVGGTFMAWGDHITGKNLELEPGKRIVQSWRTTDFEQNDPDSQIDVRFEEADGGCKVTLHHSNLPPHGTRYESGWVSHYFEPMQKYFGRTG